MVQRANSPAESEKLGTATGRRLEFPLCGVYTFDEDGKLAGERIY